MNEITCFFMDIPMTGFFITFEGGDGSGKSVQSSLLYEKLKSSSPNLVLKTREPGGSKGAEVIRQILLTGECDRWFPISEFLLFYAARYDHWRRSILPVLQQGGLVICDRFIDSSVVYQGIGSGIPDRFFDFIHEMLNFSEEKSFRSFIPDRTYILDIDPVLGIQRSNHRQEKDGEREDRFEQKKLQFHEKVREGYLKIARQNPSRCQIVNASQSIEMIQEEIWEDLQKWIQKTKNDVT